MLYCQDKIDVLHVCLKCASHKTSSTKQLVNGESVGLPVCASMKANWHYFEHNRLLSEPPTVYRGKCVVSHYFCRSYLKANEVSKSEGTREVKYAYHLWTCADAVDQKLSKLVHACRSYSQRCILLRRSVEENECFESHLYSFVKRFIFVYFEW